MFDGVKSADKGLVATVIGNQSHCAVYGGVRVVATSVQYAMGSKWLVLKVTDPGTDVVAVIVFTDP